MLEAGPAEWPPRRMWEKGREEGQLGPSLPAPEKGPSHTPEVVPFPGLSGSG